MLLKKLFSTKMSPVFSGILLLFAALVFGLFYIYSYKDIADGTKVDLPIKLADAAKLINARLNERIKVLETIAARNDIRSMDFEIQKKVLTEEVKRTGFLEIAIIDNAGTGHYLDGTTLDLNARDYFKKAKQGVSNVSDMIISKAINLPVVMVATPIYNGNEVKGVLIGRMSGKELSIITDDISVGKTGFAYMVNDKGTLVSHKDSKLVMQKYNFLEEAKKDSELKRNTNFIEALISKGELFDEYEYQNKRYFSFGRKIEGTNWFLIITYPREEAFESLNSRITAFALIIFAILIICTAVSDLFQRKLVLVPIRTVIERLILSSDHFQVSSRKLSSASQQLAEGSSEQVASLETTSATMEETASMVKQNTENTRQTAILSSKSTDSAKDGFIKMSELNASMEEIKNSSDDIAKIIQVINEIAFQTNILALNAAVEAAKAGEVGASFAVVAEEVRNLAQRSANAAQDTAAKIDRNIELSQKGVDECGLVSRSFEEIKDSTEKVNALIAGITTASEEQAKGTEQIAKAISQIWQVTQKNAALAEESSASSEEIQTQSEEIVAIVGDLNRFVK